MQSITTSILGAILFFFLIPGLFIRLPKNGSRMTVAIVHALVFGIIYFFIHKPVYTFVRNMEGITNQQPSSNLPKSN